MAYQARHRQAPRHRAISVRVPVRVQVKIVALMFLAQVAFAKPYFYRSAHRSMHHIPLPERKYMKRKLKSLGAVFVLLASFIIVGVASGAGSASAAACGTINPSAQYSDGWYSLGSAPVYGMSANMRYEKTSLCTGNNTVNNAGSAWVMVDNGTTGWAQVGQYFDPTMSCMEHFAQSVQNYPATPVSTVFYGNGTGHCVSNDDVHQDWLTYFSPYGAFILNVDSTNLQVSSFNPLTTWTHFASEEFGEVKSLNSNMPGNAARPTEWSNEEWSPVANASFSSTCGAGGLVMQSDDIDNPSHWAIAGVSCNDVKIYTSVPQ